MSTVENHSQQTTSSTNDNSSKNKKGLLGCLIPLVIIGVAVILFMYLGATRDKPVAAEPEEPILNIRTVTAKPASHSPVIALYGRAEARRNAYLTAAINADVAEVATLPGATVTLGERLVRLDDREAQLTLDQAEADLALLTSQYASDETALKNEQRLLTIANQELKRFTDLKQRGLASQSQLDAARQAHERQQLATAQRELAVRQFNARRAQAKARVARAQLDLDRTQIKAPFAGRVIAVPVSVGDRVTPGQPVVTLYDPSSIEIRATIPNRYLDMARAGIAAGGLKATLVDGDQRTAAKLLRLAASSSMASGGTDGFFSIADSDNPPLPGRSLRLALELPSQPDSVILPFESVFGLKRVYRVHEERLESVAIERLGEFPAPEGTTGSWLLIRSAELKTGDLVLATQLPTATSGLKVRVVGSESD